MTSYKECLVIVCKNRQRCLIEYSFRKIRKLIFRFRFAAQNNRFRVFHSFVDKRFEICVAFKVFDFLFFGRVFGAEGVKIVQQSSYGRMLISYVSISFAFSMISVLSMPIKGRKTGVLVTALMAYMLSSVWLATWPRLSL